MSEVHEAWWRRGWARWMKIAGVIGDFQARLVLSVFYFIIVLPFGLAVRIFSDPLKIRRARSSAWTDFSDRADSVEKGRLQF